MSREARRPDEIEAEYRQRKLAVREDPGLSWEEKELTVKALGDEYHRTRKQAEREAA
jgi:hypothetical protein